METRELGLVDELDDQGRTDRDGNTENESDGSAAARLFLHNGDVQGETSHKS
jgi:hypothetical protein